jgi:cell division transport system ATP-binding protein
MFQNNLEHTFTQTTPLRYGNSDNVFYLEGVSVSFGNIEALKSVQISIDKKEIVFISGASGAGKTTLLKVLSGEIIPQVGRVKRLGKGGGNKEPFVARVFQDLRLIEDHSCLENLQLSYDSKIYSSRNEFQQDMMELCKILGINDRLNLKIKDANGGLKQKVAIIRALLSRPDVFIADEPTSSLDYENARKLFELLNLYNVKRGLTIIWASHNRELVKKFSGRIIHLDGGKVVYSGHACFI